MVVKMVGLAFFESPQGSGFYKDVDGYVFVPHLTDKILPERRPFFKKTRIIATDNEETYRTILKVWGNFPGAVIDTELPKEKEAFLKRIAKTVVFNPRLFKNTTISQGKLLSSDEYTATTWIKDKRLSPEDLFDREVWHHLKNLGAGVVVYEPFLFVRKKNEVDVFRVSYKLQKVKEIRI